ncbi:ATP-binding protein [Candidatus Woesearchaeota archaeon]|jgi:uncharacterized protein|nr:ATP-binding protein [Candidatus Woesearchaeota archaeon]
MILGRIVGKVSTTNFQFSVSSSKTKKFQFIQVNHPEYGFVLGQVMELIRSVEGMTARCNVIGYKDLDGRIKGIRTPFELNAEILEAEDSFIKKVIELKTEGGFIGKLEGKEIPIKIDFQKILTKHLCVLAKSGAGKSYTVGVLLEEIMEKGVPLLIIDPHGEYSSLKFPSEDREKLIEWKLEAKGYGGQIQEYGDMNVKDDVRPLKLNEKVSNYELMRLLPLQLTNTQEAILFSVIKDLEEINFDNILLGLEELNSSGKWGLIDTIMYLRDLELFSSSYTDFNELITPGKCSIINLKGINPEVQDIIVYKLLKDLFMARKQEKIPPFFCVVEEAHNFVPEKGFGKSKSGDVIRLISSEGRKFGLGLCVVSQRPALVQKTVLSQCSTQIIMKVTNPNDLRAIVGSIEGITSETEEEIQRLPIGSCLLCGVVDRPLVVNVRPRRSKHGGQAVDMLKINSEEYEKDVVEESKEFEDKGILPILKPNLSIKDLRLMADKEIKEIKTYLIPAVLFNVSQEGTEFKILVERIKGKVIVDPEKEIKGELKDVREEFSFFKKPVYEEVNYDIKLDAVRSIDELKEELNGEVLDWKECYIVYNKVNYN